MSVSRSNAPFRFNDILVIIKSCFLCHGRKSFQLQCFVAPIRRKASNFLLCLLRDFKPITVSFSELIQLFHHPVNPIFRKNWRRLIFTGLIPCQKTIIININRHISQNRFQTLSSQPNYRKIFIFLIYLGNDFPSLRANRGRHLNDIFPHFSNSFRQPSYFHISFLPECFHLVLL